MSIKKSKNEIIAHISSALEQMRVFLLELINSIEIDLNKKADLISYWIEDWLRYLNYEDEFKMKFHSKFKRGSIIQVNFGFNVGTELGGRHYAITLDKHDNEKIPDIVVIPLTSIKEDTDLDKLKNDKSRINLDDYIYKIITEKFKAEFNEYVNKIKQIDSKDADSDNDGLNEKTALLHKHRKELEKIKKGSIAHIRQIRSISKMRIIAPTKKTDLLNNLKVSEDILKKIDSRINETMLSNQQNNA